MAQERQKNWLTFLFRDTSLVAVAIVCSSLVFVVFERIVVGIDTGGCMGTVELEAHEDDSQAHTDQSDRDDGQVEVSGEQETDEQSVEHFVGNEEVTSSSLVAGSIRRCSSVG